MERRTWMVVGMVIIFGIFAALLFRKIGPHTNGIVPNSNDMVRVSKDNDYITIWHDNKRGITCWERECALSCVKD